MRLINADKLKWELSMSIEEDSTIDITDILNFIDEMPTIIEADKEGAEEC